MSIAFFNYKRFITSFAYFIQTSFLFGIGGTLETTKGSVSSKYFTAFGTNFYFSFGSFYSAFLTTILSLTAFWIHKFFTTNITGTVFLIKKIMAFFITENRSRSTGIDIIRERLITIFADKFFYHGLAPIWSTELQRGKRLGVSLLSVVNYATQAPQYYTTMEVSL